MIKDGRYQFDERCGRVAEVLKRVGDKWSVLLIVLLECGPRRFNDLKRSIPGISQRMLTLTLRGLERDGLIGRTVVPNIPPHVTYDLTPLGRSLAVPVRVLCDWAHESIAAIDAARANYAEAERAGVCPPPTEEPRVTGPRTVAETQPREIRVNGVQKRGGRILTPTPRERRRSAQP